MSDAGDTTTVVSSDASSSGRILEVHGTTIDDAISWKRTADIHKHGCMRIAQRIPSLASHWKTSLGLLKPGDPDDGYRITLADVHRMYLRKLQRKLVWLAMNHQFDADRGVSTMDQWRPAIREFIDAVKDHEYMVSFVGRKDDPFIVSSERYHDHSTMEDLMNDKGKFSSDLKGCTTIHGHWENVKDAECAKPILNTRGSSYSRAHWSRIVGVLVAGAFLVGPMWLLVLQRDVFVHLGVTTFCVMAFAFVMVWWATAIETVLAATFAYAAVLMVFVGVMMQELH